MRIDFDFPGVGTVHLFKPADEVLETVEALVKLGKNPTVHLDTTDEK